jgi:hypothetical protein
MTEIEKTTPRPLSAEKSMDRILLIRRDPKEIVGEIYEEEDAALIVKAVNGFEKMLTACNEAVFLLDRLGQLDFEDLRDLSRDFDGHVEPSICRLRRSLTEVRAAINELEESRSSLGEVRVSDAQEER